MRRPASRCPGTTACMRGWCRWATACSSIWWPSPFGSFGPAVTPGQGRARLMCMHEGLSLATERDLAAEQAHRAAVIEALPFLDPEQAPESAWLLADAEEALRAVEALPGLPGIAALDWPKGKPLRVKSLDSPALNVSVSSGARLAGPRGRSAGGRAAPVEPAATDAARPRIAQPLRAPGRGRLPGAERAVAPAVARSRRAGRGEEGPVDAALGRGLVARRHLGRDDVRRRQALARPHGCAGRGRRPAARRAARPARRASALPARGLCLDDAPGRRRPRRLPGRRHGPGQDGADPGPAGRPRRPGPRPGAGAHLRLRQLAGRDRDVRARPAREDLRRGRRPQPADPADGPGRRADRLLCAGPRSTPSCSPRCSGPPW